MVSLLGFTTAYISLSKTLIPSIAVAQVGVGNAHKLPHLLQMNEHSKILWASIFSFVFLLPMACFRELSMLRYTSLLGVACSFTLAVVLLQQFFSNKDIVPQPALSQFSEADYFKLDSEAVICAIPFIIFLFMYQPNIPQTYSELQIRTP
jgi:amino acid permease